MNHPPRPRRRSPLRRARRWAHRQSWPALERCLRQLVRIVAGTRAGASVANSAVVAWLADGTPAPTPAQATCRVTTSAGRIDDRTFLLVIAER